MIEIRLKVPPPLACAALAMFVIACAQSDFSVRESALDGGPPDAGPHGSDVDYERCHGDPLARGSCGEGYVCGSLPNVGFDYCLPAAPCPADMVTVFNAACAYPCSEAVDCDALGLRACAPNALAELTGEAFGWCTP